jgi:putative transposase
VDDVAKWSERTGIAVKRIVPWLGVRENKFYDQFHDEHPLEGYRRLTFLMLDADVVAVAPATVHRVLSQHGKLKRKHWSPAGSLISAPS